MSKEYFKTSDGNVFYTRNAAENHAKSLVDKTIATTETVVMEELVEANESVATEEPIKKKTTSKK